MTLDWLRCHRCGGRLPCVDRDNGSLRLPQRLRYGGECPGHLTPEGLCGAYDGWSSWRIMRYVRRRGVRVTVGPWGATVRL
jgi:hypothetical protein